MPMAKSSSCWCLLFSVMASLTSILPLTMCSGNGWDGPRYGPRKWVPIGISHQGLTILLAIIIGPGNPDLSQSARGIFPGTRIGSFSTDLKWTNQGSCCWFREESRSWMRTRKQVAQEVTGWFSYHYHEWNQADNEKDKSNTWRREEARGWSQRPEPESWSSFAWRKIYLWILLLVKPKFLVMFKLFFFFCSLQWVESQ